MAKNQQVPNATVQGEVLLAKYLTESIRSIEQCIRKAASHGAPLASLPRSLSAPRIDPRAEGRRPSTEVLLPRNFPAAYAPVAAAAAAAAVAAAATAATTKVAATRPTATGGQVAAMQSRLLQPGTAPYGSTTVQHRPNGATVGTSMQPVLPKATVGAKGASPLPPRPAVLRTSHAAQQQQQQHHQYQQQQQQKQQQHQYAGAAAAGTTNSPGGNVGIKSQQGRSASAPRIEDAYGQEHRAQPPSPSPSPHSPHDPRLARNDLARMSSSGVLQPSPRPHPRHARSEARVPAVAAAPPLAGLLAGRSGVGARPQGDARSSASVRRSAPSDAGTHASWWRWRPVTDASYPMTAVTDRYAQSMTPSELVRWNDRVARLEAEITAEKERRLQFEEQLKKLKVVTKSEPQAQGMAGSGRQTNKAVSHPFR